jgi:demethylmenaquinone methyltransferase/2-methoxy-6-polyprenyl-1,4-benzoquinol methylase
MANRFFDPGIRRAERVQELFARVAARYDLMNDLQSFGLHRRWKRYLVELARPLPEDHALDVCCGTGDIALELARHGSKVTGVDFSEPMLEIAREKAFHGRGSIAKADRFNSRLCNADRTKTGQDPASEVRPGEKRVDFIQGDAQQLPFGDGTFDIVTVGYGLRNLSDWEKGIREMHRVAKPGARLLVLDFGKPENRLWRGIYYGYLKLFVPLLGLVFCGSASAYAYILESLKHYPAQQGVATQMKELGLTQVRVVSFLGGIMSINYGERV